MADHPKAVTAQDTGRRLAGAEILASEPQAAELECVARAGLLRPALIDGSKISWGAYGEARPRPFVSGNVCSASLHFLVMEIRGGIPYPFKNCLPFAAFLEQDCGRIFVLLQQRIVAEHRPNLETIHADQP
jgi:hypothetical protein